MDVIAKLTVKEGSEEAFKAAGLTHAADRAETQLRAVQEAVRA